MINSYFAFLHFNKNTWVVWAWFFGVGFFSNGISQTSINSSSNYAIADSLASEGNYKDALIHFELELQKPHTNNYVNYLQARWHLAKSSRLEQLGGLKNHTLALLYSKKAQLYLSKTNGYLYQKYWASNRIYHQMGYSRQWDLAFEEAKNCLAFLKDTLPETDAKTFIIYDDLGYIANKLGDPLLSLEFYEKSMALYKKYHPNLLWDMGVNYGTMAKNYRELGMRHEELKMLNEVYVIFNQDTFTKQTLHHKYDNLSHLADWYMYYGDYASAKIYLDKKEKLMDKLNSYGKPTEKVMQHRARQLSHFSNLIDLYFATDDIKRVEVLLPKYRALMYDVENTYQFDIEHQAKYFDYLAKLPSTPLPKKIRSYKNAIALLQESKSSFFTKSTPFQLKLLDLYQSSGDLTQARGLVSELLRDNDLTTNEAWIVMIHQLRLAVTNNSRSRDSLFKIVLKGIFKDETTVNDPNILTLQDLKPLYSFETIDGLLTLSEIKYQEFLKTNDKRHFNWAFTLGKLASQMFNQLYLNSRFNTNLKRYYGKIESTLINLLQNSSNTINTSHVLLLLEANKSKLALSKFIYSKYKHQVWASDSLLYRNHDLNRLWQHYQIQLVDDNLKSALKDSIRVRLAKIEFEMDRINKAIKGQNQEFLLAFDFNHLKRTQKFLREKECILQYHTSHNFYYCFVITKKNIQFYKLGKAEQIDESVMMLYKKLKTFDSENCLIDANLQIIPKIIKNKTFNKFKIIPSGSLNLLPFEMVLGSVNANSNFKSKLAVSYSQSLSMLGSQSKSPMDFNPPKVAIYTNSAEKDLYLPAIEREIEAIGSVFSLKFMDTIPLQDYGSYSNEYQILHLAMHTKLNMEFPESSYFEMPQGALPVAALYHASLNAKFAVLSACDTGYGTDPTGDGIQSLAQGFTFAGVPSILASLWKVDDKATAAIIGFFYKNLADGMAKDEALALAKINYLNTVDDEALKHPYYWSGFRIIGDITPMVSPKMLSNNYLILGVCFIIFIVSDGIYSKKLLQLLQQYPCLL